MSQNPVVLDLETNPASEEEILSRLPEWDETEARTRLPRNYKSNEAVSGWLESDKANHTKSILERAALMPEFASVVVAGLWINGKVEQLVLEDSLEYSGTRPKYDGWWFSSEQDLLEAAWRELNRADKIVGWNLLGFDLPFMVRRSWILGVKVPHGLFNPLSRYPFGDRVVDLMQVYSAGRYDDKRTSLDNALKALGLPPKTGSGRDFPKLWREDRKAALAYNEADCRLEALCAQRMGVIRPEVPVPVAKLDEEDVIPV